jgi:hypothetical protein
MPHFIQLFFEQLGAEFPFLSYEETLAHFFDQTLPPLLANCIASLAVRCADLCLVNFKMELTMKTQILHASRAGSAWTSQCR